MASCILRRCTSILAAQPKAPLAQRTAARRVSAKPGAVAMASSTPPLQARAPLARASLLRLGLTAFVLLSVADCAAAAGQEKKNVLGGPLEVCCTSPMTGYYRNGYCQVDASDFGNHSVCAQVTQEFLDYTASQGNDLSSVVKAGQRWCLCSGRWKQAKKAGKAPPVVLKSTAQEALASVTLEELKEHAIDADAAATQ